MILCAKDSVNNFHKWLKDYNSLSKLLFFVILAMYHEDCIISTLTLFQKEASSSLNFLLTAVNRS